MLRLLAIAFTLLGQTPDVSASPTPVEDRVGDVYEVRLDARSRSESDNGSSGSSTDIDALTERVVAIHGGDVELVFDLPAKATEADRASNWQFPARVLKPVTGPLQLTNAAEMETRVDPWLKAGDMTREQCGQWIFTWNAFKIDCDPQSILPALARYDMRPGDLVEGGLHEEPGVLAPQPWRREAGSRSAAWFVEMQIDPAAVRRELAERDVIVGEITRAPVSLEQALANRNADRISGTITLRYETDHTGRVVRRVRTTSTEITDAEGVTEKKTITETATRRRISRGH